MPALLVFFEVLLEALVAGFARLLRFLFGGEALDYVSSLLWLILIAATLPICGIVAALIVSLGFENPEFARFLLLVGLWTGLPLLTILGGGTAFAVDVLANAAFGKKKEETKEIFRGFLGVPLWTLVIAEIVLLVGVWAPLEAVILGLLGAFGLVLLAFIRKWTFSFGWAFATWIQVAFVVFALFASVPARFWMGTVGFNLRPAFSLAWAPPVDERRLDRMHRELAEMKANRSTLELRAIQAEMRRAKTEREIEAAAQSLRAWEKKHSTGIPAGIARITNR